MCENLEIARRANEPFNAGEIEAAFALFHPEVEFRATFSTLLTCPRL